MNPEHRTKARFAGVMFLVATAASLTGGTLIQIAIEGGELDPTSRPAGGRWMLLTGVSLEVVNSLAVLGIAAALWAILARDRPAMAIGYVAVRIAEAVVCAVAAFLPVAILALQGGMETGAPLALAVRSALVGNAVPIFFLVGAVLLYSMLYRSAVVPRYIAVWGLVGAAGLVANLLVAQPDLQPLLVLPIIANEIYLGVYLLIRGVRNERKPLTGFSGDAGALSPG